MLHGVIMAGGRGERFWPYGLRRRPKQFLDLFGGGSLLQHTARRIEPLVPWERMWVVTTADYADAVRAQLPSLPFDHVLVEPEGRNTAPCLALALAHLRHRTGLDGDEVMAVLPADHWIRDEEGFRALLADAAAVAEGSRELVTLGIEPTGPETGYGYIQVGPELGRAPGGHPFRRVARFVEKPSRDRAEAMLAEGGYLWNSGMFIWRLDALEEAFGRYLPEVAEMLPRLGGPDTPELYARMPSVSIDVGVMEKADRVLVLPAGIGWSDVGHWAAVGDLLPRDGDGNAGRGTHVAIDSRGCVVFDGDADGEGAGGGHVVVTIGVENLVVVRTAHATLVCPRDRVQDVREAVRRLETMGRRDAL